MTPREQVLLDRLVEIARGRMTPGELGRFEAEVRRMFKYRAKRDPRELEREHLLERHCPAVLPAITIDRPTKPLPAKRRSTRRRHTWKQLHLPL